jgi:hypothetical protein
MRKKFILLGLVFSCAAVYSACSKGSDPDPTPPNPCAGVTVAVTGTTTNASAGQSNGSITVNATGGSGFTFSLNNGTFQASGTFSNLAAGNYTITAKNSNGCTGSAQFTVGTNNPCTGVTINVTTTTSTAIPCPNPNSGGITVTATGGTGPYTYSRDGGATFQANNVFSSLAAGNYNIVARDANGCTSAASVTNVTAAAPGPLFSAVRTIVQTNCAVTGCHDATTMQSGINFNNNCDIVAQSARIKARAVDGNPSFMPPPPRPQLSAADKQAINNWVAAGGGFTN